MRSELDCVWHSQSVIVRLCQRRLRKIGYARLAIDYMKKVTPQKDSQNAE